MKAIDDPAQTRRRLADAATALAADPANAELVAHVRHLRHALGCLLAREELHRLAARAWLALECWARRN